MSLLWRKSLHNSPYHQADTPCEKEQEQMKKERQQNQHRRRLVVLSRRCLQLRKRALRRWLWGLVFAMLRPSWLYRLLGLLKPWPKLAERLARARDFAEKRSKKPVFIKKLKVSAEQIASYRHSRAPTPPPMRQRQLGEDPERGRGEIKAKNPELHAQVMQGLSAERESFRSVPAPKRRKKNASAKTTKSSSQTRKRIRSFDEARKVKER